MCVNLRTKFQVSSIILTSFRLEGGEGGRGGREGRGVEGGEGGGRGGEE